MPLQFIRESRESIITRLDTNLPKATFMDVMQQCLLGTQHITVADYVREKTAWLWRPKYTYEFQQLLSNFQKAMRLRDAEQCLATAVQLLGQDPANFLRRLPVVLLEDAMLQPHLYAQVVWLMIAVGKCYALAVEDVQLIVDAIATGLDAEERYDLGEETMEEEDELSWFRSDVDDVLKSAFVAIKLRAGAGGMRFDTEFLERLATRLRAGTLPLQEEVSSIDAAEIPEFAVADHMLPAAIDFHCNPNILESAKVQSGLKPATIKEAIWWHRSSLNVRSGPASLMAVEAGQRFRTAQHWGLIAPTVSAYAARQLQLLEERKVRCKPVQTLDGWFNRHQSKMEVD
jgi:hypothetical protein